MAKQMALLGASESGAAWAARFSLMGWHVRVFDPEPGAKERVSATLGAARQALPALYDTALPPAGAVTYHDSLRDAVDGADWVQEALPNRIALKQKMIQAVQARLEPEAVIAMEADGFSPDELHACATRAGQIVAMSGLRPEWLWPTPLLAGGAKTPAAQLDRAEALLRDVGMQPIRAPGDRPLAEIWPELDGVAPRAALGALAAAGPDLAAQVALLRVLKRQAAPGPGAALAAHEAALAPRHPGWVAATCTLDRQVPSDWVDYNGHMNEAYYLTAFSDATDQMLLWAGMDADCVADGHSVFTVETHIRHLDEVNIGDRITVTSRVLDGAGKRLHLWHELFNGRSLAATGEQLLLHVDLNARRPALPRPDVGAELRIAEAAQANLPLPEGAGRFVGAPRG